MDKRKFQVLILFFCYILFIFALTFSPYDFSKRWLDMFLSHGVRGILYLLFYLDPSDILNNFILFIPFGWILYFVIESFGVHNKRRFVFPIVCGLLISTGIEAIQLFLDRSVSVMDVVANTGGTVLGFYSARQWHWHRRIQLFLQHLFMPQAVRIATTLLYACGLAYVMALPFQINRFSNWDASFPLLIGNEATMNKPWNGEINLLTIFPHALNSKDVLRLYRTESRNDVSSIRKRLGTIAYYPFIEGQGDTIHDCSGVVPPLHLFGQNIPWLPDGSGIQFKNGNALSSRNPAEKLSLAIQKTSSFTIECRFRTLSLPQIGPARIVTISADLDNRNVSLGQSGGDLVVRVRTPLSGPNSSRFYLSQNAAIPDTLFHHFVVVYDHGVIKTYRNGVLLEPIVRGDTPYLFMILHLGRNAVSKIAFYYIFIFPLGILLGMVFRRKTLLWTLSFAAAFYISVALVFLYRFGQPLGWYFLSDFLLFAILGASIAILYKKSS